MRGKVNKTQVQLSAKRITPAYAGKRTIEKFANTPDQDHPRLCGEKSQAVRLSKKTLGSPPPMRGKGTVRGKSIRPWRITPAYAGKSCRGLAALKVTKDHPRLCGEKFPPSYNDAVTRGSPPPMRGKGPS